MNIPGIILLRQNFLIILVFFGMVLSGLIYLNNIQCSCNQQITEQVIIKSKWKQKTFGLRSSSGLFYNQPSALVLGYTRFVKDFLESAEKYYFVGFRVHYYLFTDKPESVPEVKMGENRSLTVRKVPSLNRWQDISMNRMEKLEKLIEDELSSEADYIFCLDIDTKFYGRWGAESLGRLVGVIHPWFFDAPRDRFTYERRPVSQAYIPAEEGDYYYAGAAFGGSLKDVHHLTKTCRENLNIDAARSIEAVWQEESHLNKYFLLNKPSKLLSPEYMWRDINEGAAQIKIIRFTNVPKNYAEVRPNP
ncbi:histo-blood group ABO system transferase-like isoform X2 [Onychostoma macrolepis]|uniref:histo-blood group ABO system transferase-like isoform X2 n=1 Tax=Onychostoma macrolepis TaxID=369639 RepID=UPI00272AD53A|nr:histo-blood group ABO system transferase-like isoform X2 [Onychostoma macrolepis]